MASFGSGFAGGMYAGSAVAQRGMDNYEKRQNEEMEGKLFQLANEEGELDAEGNQRSSIMNSLSDSSMGDITKSLTDMYEASGEKIDSKTYGLISKFSAGLFGIKEKEKEYQEKRGLFDLKVEKANADIDRTRHLTANGDGSGKPKITKLMQNAEYIRDKYGDKAAEKYIASNWTAKMDAEYDDDTPTDTPKEETKAPHWSDFKNK